MKIVTAAEMREIDRVSTERFGVPSLTLMENAGSGVAAFVLEQYSSAKHIGVICGKGNNGGDGFVAARKLHEAGKEVSVVLLADAAEVRGDAAEMLRKMPVKPVIVKSGAELAGVEAFRAEVLIDAILGTGFKPPVTGLYAEAIQTINASQATVVAVDIPSGADADAMTRTTDPVAKADAMVTFTAPRPAHVFGKLTRGPVEVVAIGSPAEAVESALKLNVTAAADVAPLIGPRDPEANKGSYGHVLIVGGSVGKAGAPAMAGYAALRAGAGLSTIAVPRSILSIVAGFAMETMVEPLPETEAGTLSRRSLETGMLDGLMEKKQAIAIGPGVSRHPETAELVRTCVERYRGPLILDADALNALEGCAERLDGKRRSVVVTPHPGEMARLAGTTVAAVQKDRLNVARNFAREHSVIVVLKGHRTLIVGPNGVAWVNPTGNPGMATGGTGDVLTGIIAGLVAQHPEHVFEAVAAAVYLHGLAGDLAVAEVGEYALVAGDLIKYLPQAFQFAQAEGKLARVTLSGWRLR